MPISYRVVILHKNGEELSCTTSKSGGQSVCVVFEGQKASVRLRNIRDSYLYVMFLSIVPRGILCVGLIRSFSLTTQCT